MDKDSEIAEIVASLRTFIELSQHDNAKPWKEWVSATINNIGVSCWEIKNCDNRLCPAYMNSCGRCWIIAGTMCGKCAEGTFATKYKSCMKCEVFQQSVFKDSLTELRELLIVLIYSFRTKQRELQDAMDSMKVLQGLLPICASCKKIRDDKGYWNQLEEYISKHSSAEFSHAICPDCAKALYPQFYKGKEENNRGKEQ